MEPLESRENLERFRQVVLEDEHLLRRLRQADNLECFVALAVQLGREKGCAFAPQHVHEALQAERRVWLQKWI